MIYNIGSDPEFAFVDDKGELVPAYNILHSRSALQDTIGLDGHSSTAELRPMYSNSIYTHLNNIVRSKAQIQNICNMFSVNAVGRPLVRKESLGGHIHISTNAREDYTRKLVDRAIVLQFLALPAAKYLFGSLVYKRFASSRFRYGSPFDVRSDWGKNHIELRVFPTFLGLNNSNIFAILRYFIDGFTYLEHNRIKVPEIKNLSNIPVSDHGPVFLSFPEMNEKEFNNIVKDMYNFVYTEKIGFAIKFYKSLNTANNKFFIAKHGTIIAKTLQYAGIAQWLSLRTTKHVVILHGTPHTVTRGKTHYIYLDTRISDSDFLGASVSIAKKILKELS
jgi:hypothetical protein